MKSQSLFCVRKCYLSDHLIDNLTISIKGLERENSNI